MLIVSNTFLKSTIPTRLILLYITPMWIKAKYITNLRDKQKILYNLFLFLMNRYTKIDTDSVVLAHGHAGSCLGVHEHSGLMLVYMYVCCVWYVF